MKAIFFIVTPLLLSSCQSPPAPHETEQSRYREDVARAARGHEAQDTLEAYTRYLDCKLAAESAYIKGLQAEGTPVPRKQDEYQERVPGAFEKLRQQRDLDDAECAGIRDADFEQTQPSTQPEPLDPFPPGVAHAARTLSP
jgi:hypothetical protein